MKIELSDPLIPGTVLEREKMGNVTGLEFLSKIFYISSGVMLSQIREISGIDGSTLQNWTKRGWVANAQKKRYDIDQVAHILIINMLRPSMQLERITFLIRYINGTEGDERIIRESVLYDYICRIADELIRENGLESNKIDAIIRHVTEGYEEQITGARKRLEKALKIITYSYYASVMKQNSESMLEALMKN